MRTLTFTHGTDDTHHPGWYRRHMLDGLNGEERLLLLRLVASFAWVDGIVDEAEKRFVRRLMGKITLTTAEVHDVESWLLSPPTEEIPIERIAEANRRVFLESVRALMFVDGKIDPAEQEHFDRLREMLL